LKFPRLRTLSISNSFPTQAPPSDDESGAEATEIPVDAGVKSIVDGIFEAAAGDSPVAAKFISWCIRDEVTGATTAAMEETGQVSFQWVFFTLLPSFLRQNLFFAVGISKFLVTTCLIDF
jgi:hypothetical protein